MQIDYAKEMLYRRLRITTPGPEYCHFPSNDRSGYDAAYFEGLTIEKMMTDKAAPYFVKRNTEDRNEPIDLRVMSMCSKELANPEWPKVKKWLATTAPNDWRPEQERRRALADLPIPDLRDVQMPSKADVDANLAALSARIDLGSKKWMHII